MSDRRGSDRRRRLELAEPVALGEDHPAAPSGGDVAVRFGAARASRQAGDDDQGHDGPDTKAPEPAHGQISWLVGRTRISLTSTWGGRLSANITASATSSGRSTSSSGGLS